MIILWLLFIIGGFLLGSVLFSKLIPAIILKKNICAIGDDGNPGAANVFIKCGVGYGFICLFCDMLKGIIPVLVASFFLNTENLCFSLVMIAPVLGHALGIFNRFHGGKCISTTFGVLIGILHISRVGLILAILYIVFSTLVKISPNSRRSILSFSLFICISTPPLIIFGYYSIAIGCVGMSLISIIKHFKIFTKIESVALVDAIEEKKEIESVL